MSGDILDNLCERRMSCEPPRFPEALTETWKCPRCGREYVAFDPNTDPIARVPKGRTAGLGWRTQG